MKKNILIIGQGIAGSFLAWYLLKEGKRVLVVDDSHATSSSAISAGIINPVTGKRFAITPGFDMYFYHAKEFYGEMEKFFGEEFFEEKPIIRIFRNGEEKEKWRNKTAKGLGEAYAEPEEGPGRLSPAIDDSLGSVRIIKGGYCRTRMLLENLRRHFIRSDVYCRRHIRYNEIKVSERHVEFHGDTFDRVVFCEGYRAQENPWFEDIEFANVKGETLMVEQDTGTSLREIYMKGKWCLPQGGNLWAAGSTYDRDRIDCEPTQEGRKEILDALPFRQPPERVVDHKAGVRPVLSDQRPVVGTLEKESRVGILNGLGSKGFLIAPYYAKMLAGFMNGRADLPADVDVNRYVKSSV